jgi:hypothetical protein
MLAKRLCNSGAIDQTIAEYGLATSLTYKISKFAIGKTRVSGTHTCIGAIAGLHTEVISARYVIITVNWYAGLTVSRGIARFDSVAYQIVVAGSIVGHIVTLITGVIASGYGAADSITTIRWSAWVALRKATGFIEETGLVAIAELTIITNRNLWYSYRIERSRNIVTRRKIVAECSLNSGL